MATQIVEILAFAVDRAASLQLYLFNRTGTWGLVFSAICLLLVCRFILGPVTGFVRSGSSDVVKRSIRRGSKHG